jgi:uncharacterized membrane protein
MKLLVSLLSIAIVSLCVFQLSSQIVNRKKKQNDRTFEPILLTTMIAIMLLGFVILQMYKAAIAPDTQCTTIHTVTANPPHTLNLR